jgi:hypothetical protein
MKERTTRFIILLFIWLEVVRVDVRVMGSSSEPPREARKALLKFG